MRILWESVPGVPLSLLGFARRHLAFQRFQQTCLDVLWNLLRLTALVNLQRLLGRVDDDKAVRALRDVRLQATFYIRVAAWVQKIVQFLKELFTGKQRRLPLFA